MKISEKILNAVLNSQFLCKTVVYAIALYGLVIYSLAAMFPFILAYILWHFVSKFW